MNLAVAKLLIAGGGLTVRQIEVLTLIAEGHTYVSAGRTLFLTTYTVTRHAKNARERLGAKTTTEAVVIALQIGALNLESLGQQRAGSPAPRPPSAIGRYVPLRRRRARAGLDG